LASLEVTGSPKELHQADRGPASNEEARKGISADGGNLRVEGFGRRDLLITRAQLGQVDFLDLLMALTRCLGLGRVESLPAGLLTLTSKVPDVFR
jgi:hypothetical protein